MNPWVLIAIVLTPFWIPMILAIAGGLGLAIGMIVTVLAIVAIVDAIKHD